MPSGFEFLDHFPVIWSGKAGQILFVEFFKDGLADNVDEFANGGLTNPPVIL